MGYIKTLEASSLPLRLKKELSLHSPILDFTDKEYISVLTKSGHEGLLIIAPEISDVAVPIRLTNIVSSKSGTKKPVICDFCYSWLPSSKVSIITFMNTTDKSKTHTFYCCSKLNCPENVRGISSESVESRAQLHEDMSNDSRVTRLKNNLARIIDMISD